MLNRRQAMFAKFQDFLLVVVFVYALFRIIWGEGFTTINLFLLLGSIVALISLGLKKSGAYERARKEKEEAISKQKEK